jgi:hypothetical protein
MREDELHRQIAELVADHADRASPPPIGAIRRRGRRRRARLAGVTAGVVLAMVAGVVGVDRLTSRPAPLAPAPTTISTTRPVPAGPVARVPAGGFEVPLPAGWVARKVGGPPAERGEAIIELVPRRAMSLNAAIVLQTQVLLPEQHPGLPPGEDPGRGANQEGLGFYTLDDRGSPLGRGHRPDGRPYVWRTRKLPDEVGEYAIAWPYHCHKAVACPPANRWRVLVVHAGRSDDPAVRQKLQKIARQVVNTVRPITNALAGGDPAHLDPALTVTTLTVTPTTGPRP